MISQHINQPLTCIHTHFTQTTSLIRAFPLPIPGCLIHHIQPHIHPHAPFNHSTIKPHAISFIHHTLHMLSQALTNNKTITQPAIIHKTVFAVAFILLSSFPSCFPPHSCTCMLKQTALCSLHYSYKYPSIHSFIISFHSQHNNKHKNSNLVAVGFLHFQHHSLLFPPLPNPPNHSSTISIIPQTSP